MQTQEEDRKLDKWTISITTTQLAQNKTVKVEAKAILKKLIGNNIKLE